MPIFQGGGGGGGGILVFLQLIISRGCTSKNGIAHCPQRVPCLEIFMYCLQNFTEVIKYSRPDVTNFSVLLRCKQKPYKIFARALHATWCL